MSDLDELLKQATRIQQGFDNMRIRGQGWSGNARDGFEFNPVVSADHIGQAQAGGGTPTPMGMCCVGGDCSITTEADCISSGGMFHSEETDCSTTGACCNDTTCTTTTENCCNDNGGIYQGDGTLCAPNPCTTLPSCSCGFDAFDGSGRKFLTYTRHVTGSFEFDDTASGGRTETGSVSSEYVSHFDFECNEVVDTNSASSHRDGGIDSGDPCSDSNSVDCFCMTSGPLPQGLCTGFLEYCQFCVPALTPFPASDNTVTTAATQTRTVDLSGSCSGGGGYTCNASGSYVVEETLSNECNPV